MGGSISVLQAAAIRVKGGERAMYRRKVNVDWQLCSDSNAERTESTSRKKLLHDVTCRLFFLCVILSPFEQLRREPAVDTVKEAGVSAPLRRSCTE